MTKDTGILKKIDETWIVYPDNMPISFLELWPLDVEAMNKGSFLSAPADLTVEFEVVFVGKRNDAGKMNYKQYARII